MKLFRFASALVAAMTLTACLRNQTPAQTAQLTCQLLMVNEPAVKLASEQIGMPLDSYVEQICAALPVVEPLLRQLRVRSICIVQPQPWTPNIAGAPSQ